MGDERHSLKREIREKLQDEVLRGALGRFAEAYPIARAKAYEGVDVEALRDAVRAMKIDAVERIEELANRFEKEATARGARVFRASTGEDVERYLTDLCRARGVRRIVKSKSMASEEIHLGPSLKKRGFEVTETDLGEWIISLAGHRPSHMVMPAIHLNRKQVAAYFSRELREDVPSDIPFLVQRARKNLRRKFIEADMGISGANLGIAENGAIVLVTNEGNARLCTTVPPIHVAIVGYEKLIPTVSDAALILKALPRSATAQLMTSYVSLISGPTPVMVKQEGRWEERMREMHIILLDNGRLQAARDDHFRQIYQCVRCASCLNVCPVYTIVGGHVYGGHTYAGGIGAILTAFVHGMKEFERFHELCIGCRRCTEVCPGKIDIPGLIEELRIRSVKEKGLPFVVKTIVENIVSNRRLFHAMLRAASLGQKPFQSGRFIRHLPLFLAGLAKDRSLPAVASVPLRDRIGKILRRPVRPVRRVAFFSGCSLDFVFPETGESVVRVLQDLDMEVVYPQGQGCCGKPVIALGDEETTKAMARDNIAALDEAAPDLVVVACPTGVEMLQHYGELFKDDPAWRDRAAALSGKVREFCAFVAEAYEKTGRLRKKTGRGKATYHDSCHMKRILGVTEAPRRLIEAAGYELVEMKDADKCCGMSGVFGMKFAELSMPILAQKMDNIRNTAADVAAVACPGCMVQIQGGLDKQAPGVRMKHVADLLAEDLKGSDASGSSREPDRQESG